MLEATPFSQAINHLKPGATGRDIVELLDGKANRTTALHWLSGKRAAPRWAMDLLASKLYASASPLLTIASQLKEAPERIGKRAGARNLAIYREKISRGR